MQKAKKLLDDVKKLDSNIKVLGEETLNAILQKLNYLKDEGVKTYFSPTVMILNPEPGDTLKDTNVKFEGFVYDVKYLDKLLIGEHEVDKNEIKYVENAEVKNIFGTVVYTGPAYKFSTVINLENGEHQLKVKVISQSGKSFQDEYGRIVRVDTTK